MAERVRITDVAPRDGLQNEPGVIATAEKVRLVELLCATGVDEIEVTSFVSPRWIPQLADSADVFARLADAGPGPGRPALSALVPNEKGMEAALAAKENGAPLDKVAVFTAASDTFSLRNTNASIAETIERFRPVVAMAHAAKLPVRGYISCVIACPFEGPISPDRPAMVAATLRDIGVDEIDLGDTIGAAMRQSTSALIGAVLGALGHSWLSPSRLTLHLHDTFGRAADCVRAALAEGLRSFDGAAGGLGGCPYAGTAERRAPGNIDTGLLVRTIHEAGFQTGVDLNALGEAAAFAARMTGRAPE